MPPAAACGTPQDSAADVAVPNAPLAAAAATRAPSSAASCKQRHVEVGNVNGAPVRLYFELLGAGCNKVLFIPGLHTVGAALEEQVAYFANRPEYQSLFFDHRLIGRSTGPAKAAVGLEQYTSDVETLLDEVRWPASQTHVVGFGTGALVALELAYRVDKLRSLTLVNASGGGKMLPLEGVKLYAQLKLTHDECKRVKILCRLLYSKKWLSLPAVSTDQQGKTNLDAVREKILRSHHINVIEDHPSEERSTARIDFHRVSKRRLESIRAKAFPMMLICGTKDRLVHPGNSKYLARVLHCTLEAFVGSGHAVASECAQRFNELLEQHFREAGAGPTAAPSAVIGALGGAAKECCTQKPPPASGRKDPGDAEDVVRELAVKDFRTELLENRSGAKVGTAGEEINAAEPVAAGPDVEVCSGSSGDERTSGIAGKNSVHTSAAPRTVNLPVLPDTTYPEVARKSDDKKQEPGLHLAPAMRDIFAPLETNSEQGEALVSGLVNPESLSKPGFPHSSLDWRSEQHPVEIVAVPRRPIGLDSFGPDTSGTKATAALPVNWVEHPIAAAAKVAEGDAVGMAAAAPAELADIAVEESLGQPPDAMVDSGQQAYMHRQTPSSWDLPETSASSNLNNAPLVANAVVVAPLTGVMGRSVAESPSVRVDTNGPLSTFEHAANSQLDPCLAMSKEEEEHAEDVLQELAIADPVAINGAESHNSVVIDRETIENTSVTTESTQVASAAENSSAIDDAPNAESLVSAVKPTMITGLCSELADAAPAGDWRAEDSAALSRGTVFPEADNEGGGITDFIRGVVVTVVARVADVKHGVMEKMEAAARDVADETEGTTTIVAGGRNAGRGERSETTIPGAFDDEFDDEFDGALEPLEPNNGGAACADDRDVADDVRSALDEPSANANAKPVPLTHGAGDVLGDENRPDAPSARDDGQYEGTLLPFCAFHGALGGVEADADNAAAAGCLSGAASGASNHRPMSSPDDDDDGSQTRGKQHPPEISAASATIPTREATNEAPRPGVKAAAQLVPRFEHLENEVREGLRKAREETKSPHAGALPTKGAASAGVKARPVPTGKPAAPPNAADAGDGQADFESAGEARGAAGAGKAEEASAATRHSPFGMASAVASYMSGAVASTISRTVGEPPAGAQAGPVAPIT